MRVIVQIAILAVVAVIGIYLIANLSDATFGSSSRTPVATVSGTPRLDASGRPLPTPSRPPATGTLTPPPTTTTAEATCQPTLPTAAGTPPPEIANLGNQGAAPTMGKGEFWYGGDSLWVKLAPEGILWDGNFRWWRTRDGSLTIRGRRLDGDAPALKAVIERDNGRAPFVSSILSFPTAGCWEITGHAAGASLTFVAEVHPQVYWPITDLCDSRQSLDDSHLVVIAEAEGSRAGNRGFVWQTVRVTETLRGRPLIEGRARLDIVQRLTDNIALVPGESYLLVLRRPEWQITCPTQTLARVRGDQLEPFKGSNPRPWLAGGSLSGLRRALADSGNRRP